MLGPILQALWQQAGPAIQQAFQSYIIPYASNHKALVAHAIRGLHYSYWNMSDEDRRKVNGAIAWVVKDLSGDALESANGLPIGSLVKKVFDIAGRQIENSITREYVSGELARQLEQKRGSQSGPERGEDD